MRRYIRPNNVISPQDIVGNVTVIYDGGVNVGEPCFSLAEVNFDESECIAMRWNISIREETNREKNNGNEICKGMPCSHGLPVWFIVPKDFLNTNSKAWQKLNEYLNKKRR